MRSATSAAHRVPSNAGPSPRAAGLSALPPPQRIAGSYPSFQPAGGLAPGVLRHHGAAGPAALPHDRRVRRASLLDAPSKPASHGVHKTLSLRAVHLRRTPQRLHCDTVGEMTLSTATSKRNVWREASALCRLTTRACHCQRRSHGRRPCLSAECNLRQLSPDVSRDLINLLGDVGYLTKFMLQGGH